MFLDFEHGVPKKDRLVPSRNRILGWVPKCVDHDPNGWIYGFAQMSAQVISHTESLLEMFHCNYLAPGWMSLGAQLLGTETKQALKNRSCSGVHLSQNAKASNCPFCQLEIIETKVSSDDISCTELAWEVPWLVCGRLRHNNPITSTRNSVQPKYKYYLDLGHGPHFGAQNCYWKTSLAHNA